MFIVSALHSCRSTEYYLPTIFYGGPRVTDPICHMLQMQRRQFEAVSNGFRGRRSVASIDPSKSLYRDSDVVPRLLTDGIIHSIATPGTDAQVGTKAGRAPPWPRR